MIARTCAGFALSLLLIGFLAFPADAENYALLVGVGKYDDPRIPSLAGPPNDVQLVRETLLARGFRGDAIAVLADPPVAPKRATRAAILQAFEELIFRVKSGDFVYLHFSGHGTQQPVPPNNPPSNFEPDGLDEVFLPADSGGWTAAGTIRNGIVDDEFEVLIQRLRDKGAFVWAVFDTCHSGTITRSARLGDGYAVRRIDPAALGVPVARTRSLAPGAAPKPSIFAFLKPKEQPPARAGLVVHSAVQPSEVTPEKLLPARGQGRKVYGLFTFHVVQALRSAPGATYRQIADLVQHSYRSNGHWSYNPLLEGEDVDALAFSAAPGASRVRQWTASKASPSLKNVFDLIIPPRSDKAYFTMPAGRLDLLEEGAVLALLASPADGIDQARGYARIVEARGAGSLLETVEREGKPALLPGDIGDTVYARLVENSVKLELTVARPDAAGARPEDHALVSQALNSLVEEGSTLKISLVEADRPADLRLDYAGPGGSSAVGDAPRLWLLPADGAFGQAGDSAPPSLLIRNADFQSNLDDSLRRIAKATNILRLTALVARHGSPAAKLDISLAVTRKGGRVERFTPGQTLTLSVGDTLVAEVSNPNFNDVDVTILALNSDYGIVCLFPGQRQSNRLPRRSRFASPPIGVDKDGRFGTNQLVVLSAAAQRLAPSVDFCGLQQRGLPRSRSAGPDSPVLEMFYSFAFPRTRSAAYADWKLDGVAAQIVTVKSRP